MNITRHPRRAAMLVATGLGLTVNGPAAAGQDSFQRTFVIGSATLPQAERYDTLDAFAAKVNCVKPGDRILLQAGKTYNGTLRLRACAPDAGAASGVIEVRSFDPKSPDDADAVTNLARIDASASPRALGLAWKPAERERVPRGMPTDTAGIALYALGPLPDGDVAELFHQNTRLLRARTPSDPGKQRGRFAPLAELADAAKGCRVAACLRSEDPKLRKALQEIRPQPGAAGGYAIVRTSPWSLAASPIEGSEGSTGELRLAKAIAGGGMPASTLPPTGAGVILVDAPALLDAPGEWYFDRASRTLFLAWDSSRPAPSDDDTALVMAGGSTQNAFMHGEAALAFWGTDPAQGGSYTLRVSQLAVVRSAGHTLRIMRAPNVVAARLRINQPGLSGIVIGDASGQVLVENSTILNTADNGVLVTGSRDVTIRGNTITNAGRIANQRQFGMDFNGIRAAGFARIGIAANTIADTGYAGIMLAEPTADDPLARRVQIEITGNRLSLFCDLLNDCGAIYINGRQKKEPPQDSGSRSAKVITGNQIKSPVGNMDGTPAGGGQSGDGKSRNGSYVRMVGAVYLDHQASGYDIHDNQVSGLYEPYGWKIFNKGVLNSCSRSVAASCASKGGYACYNDALDKCNAARP
jgi:parallel beta-helix repeat protein